MKAFIDCGSHKGQAIERFRRSKRYSKGCKIYAFEPIEEFAVSYKDDKGVIYIPKAVWTYDGEVPFFMDRHEQKGLRQGSTIVRSKRSGTLDKDRPVTMPCINFSSWLSANFRKSDHVIVKMNIEGAEYEVLNKMLRSGSIKLLDELFVSFHNKKMEIDPQIHNKLILKLYSAMGRYFIAQNMISYLDKDERIN